MNALTRRQPWLGSTVIETANVVQPRTRRIYDAPRGRIETVTSQHVSQVASTNHSIPTAHSNHLDIIRGHRSTGHAREHYLKTQSRIVHLGIEELKATNEPRSSQASNLIH